MQQCASQAQPDLHETAKHLYRRGWLGADCVVGVEVRGADDAVGADNETCRDGELPVAVAVVVVQVDAKLATKFLHAARSQRNKPKKERAPIQLQSGILNKVFELRRAPKAIQTAPSHQLIHRSNPKNMSPRSQTLICFAALFAIESILPVAGPSTVVGYCKHQNLIVLNDVNYLVRKLFQVVLLGSIFVNRPY